ncbi:MAG: hypothetical protein ABSG16_19755 [Candidatus Acidiferrum sp.]|jgi:hypothetical protein
MSAILYILGTASAALLVLLFWALRDTSDARESGHSLDDSKRHNLQYFAQIHQALGDTDRQFLINNAGAKLARAVYRERRGVALEFLKALDEEFNYLMRLARVIASLSPDVEALQEFERIRLSVVFHCRLEAIRMRLAFGARPLLEMNIVSDLVSRLTVRMETAMRELGERAALAAEMASASDRGDVGLG